MKSIKFAVFAVCISIMATSCASIVSHSKWPLTINTIPSGARVEITNDRGTTVYSGDTPCILKLKSGDGYFGKANYKVKITMSGYNEKVINLGTSFNGWYIGNIVFGGLIGWLIVDPLTGAMYRLDEEAINETLVKKGGETSLNILDFNKLDDETKSKLIRIN